MKTLSQFFFALLLICCISMSSCFYDNKEDLYQFLTTNCDSTNITYSQHILPMLNANCIVCHNTNSPQGNVDLEGYAKVISYVNNGSLYSSVAHASGYSPMPSAVQKLPDCQIQQLKLWIDAGALEN